MSNKQKTYKDENKEKMVINVAKTEEKNKLNNKKNKNVIDEEKDENKNLNNADLQPIIKDDKDLSNNDNEYFRIIERLNLKIKNLEEKNENELNKITMKNKEKENNIQLLNSTNQKMKQNLTFLTKKIKEIRNTLYGDNKDTTETQSTNNNNNINEKSKNEQNQEIDSKQKLINNLSNENKEIKKNIDRYYEINSKNQILNEFKARKNLKKNLQKEISYYKEISKKHNTECVKKISKLKEELEKQKNDLKSQNNELHSKNKDYIYIQSKFSLQKKEDEEYYKQIKNKRNFLDMNKHSYLIEQEAEKKENIKIYAIKRRELSRDIENGMITKIENKLTLPKIDVNPEGKIISSFFTEEELEKIKTLFLKNDGDKGEEKFKNFEEKVGGLEMGFGDREELEDEYFAIEKELKEKEEIALIEEHKIKNKEYELFQLNQDYKNKLNKNLKLKKEEKNLKDNLNSLKNRYSKIIQKQQNNQEIDQIIDDINNVVKENNNKENKDDKLLVESGELKGE